LLDKKRKARPVRTAVKPRDTGNVVNLMDALRKSLNDVGEGGASQSAKGRKPKKAASGQPRNADWRFPARAKPKANGAAKETKRPARQRKAGLGSPDRGWLSPAESLVVALKIRVFWRHWFNRPRDGDYLLLGLSITQPPRRGTGMLWRFCSTVSEHCAVILRRRPFFCAGTRSRNSRFLPVH
jgi:hypothetical protein